MTLPAGATSLITPFGFGDGHGSPPVGGPLSDGKGPIARTLQIFPPDVYPIPDSQEFNPLGYKDSPGAETDVVIPNATVTLPGGFIGVIRGYSIYIDNMLITTNVLWTLRIDGLPVTGYGNLTMFPRAAPSVANGFDTFVRLPEGVTVTVTYTNVDGGAYKIGAGFSGWMWSQAAGERWMGAGY